MKNKKATKIFNECRKKSATKFLRIELMLRLYGMRGMKHQIIKEINGVDNFILK